MNIEPMISVIIPVYGVEKYLKQCVDSVLKQTFKDFEVLLIDDGGKDNCPQIIDEYAELDSRIKAFHKANSGYGATVNYGLERALGKYISIIEPDDFIAPNMFEDLYKIAVQSEADIVKSAYYTNFETPDYKNCIKQDLMDSIDVLDGCFSIYDFPSFFAQHPSIWSAIYKKEFLTKNKLRFIEAPGAGWTDNPFQVQTMCLADKIAYTSNAYYYWRVETFNDEDALKDYTIPFKRAEDIHSWLNEQGISDKKVLQALYKREISNAFLVLHKKELYTVNDRIKCTLKFINSLEEDICLLLPKKEQKLVAFFKAHPYLCYLKLHVKKFLRTVFKIKWNNEQKYIMLFNKMFNFSSK